MRIARSASRPARLTRSNCERSVTDTFGCLAHSLGSVGANISDITASVAETTTARSPLPARSVAAARSIRSAESIAGSARAAIRAPSAVKRTPSRRRSTRRSPSPASSASRCRAAVDTATPRAFAAALNEPPRAIARSHSRSSVCMARVSVISRISQICFATNGHDGTGRPAQHGAIQQGESL